MTRDPAALGWQLGLLCRLDFDGDTWPAEPSSWPTPGHWAWVAEELGREATEAERAAHVAAYWRAWEVPWTPAVARVARGFAREGVR